MSRAAAAESDGELEADPELSLLLALRAYDAAPTAQAGAAVRAAAGASTVRAYLSALPAVRGFAPSNASDPAVFDPSGQYAAITSPPYVAVWRWGSRSGPGSAGKPYLLRAGGHPYDALFSPDGSGVIFLGSGGRVFQWQWRTSRTARQISSGLQDPVLFQASGGIFVASLSGRAVTITDLSALRGPTITIQLPCCSLVDQSLAPAIAFSPDGGELATLTDPGPVLSVFDIAAGTRILSKVVANAEVPLAVSSQGSVAVSVGGAAEVFSYVNPSQSPVVHELTSPAGLPAHCCDVDSPISLSWSPNGAALAVGSEDPWVRIWLGASSSPIYLNDTAATAETGVAFSPDGQYLLTSGNMFTPPYVSQVWQWDAATTLYLPQATNIVAAAVSPDGHTFALAEQGNKILLWNWFSDSAITLTAGPEGPHPANSLQILLAFSPNGTELVSAGPDDKIRAWNLGTDQQISDRQLPGTPTSLAFSPDGSQLAVAYAGGVTRWARGASAPVVTPLEADGGAIILQLNAAGSIQLLSLPTAAASSPLTGELIDIPAGHAVSPVTPVPLPGNSLDSEAVLPGQKLVLCSEVCYMYALRANHLRRLTPAALTPDSDISVTRDQHTLYGSTLDGSVLAWDLNPADPAITVTAAAQAAPLVQAGTGTDRVLIYGGTTPAEVVPTAQDGNFAAVLQLARNEAVRSLTPAEQEQYLSGSGPG